MRENPPKRCRGETENGRESGCRNRNAVKTISIEYSRCHFRPARQQPGSQDKSRGDRRTLGGSRGKGQ